VHLTAYYLEWRTVEKKIGFAEGEGVLCPLGACIKAEKSNQSC
jgi:hypothetical protein